MSVLLFLTRPDQVPAAQREAEARPDVRLVTGDLATAHALERLGVPFVDEWRGLDAAALAALWHEAHALAEEWWPEALSPPALAGVPLPRVARQELAWPLLAALVARHQYAPLLSDGSVREIEGFFLPDQAILRTGPAPGNDAAASVAHAVLRWLAEGRGIPVRRRPLPAAGGGGRSATGRPAILTHEPPPARPAPRTVLLMDAGLRPAEVLALHRRLAADPSWRLARLGAFDLAPGGALGDAALPAPLGRALAASWEAFTSLPHPRAGAHPEIFANPALLFQFRALWEEMTVAAQMGQAFIGVLDAVAPDVVVLGHDAFTRERLLVHLAQRRGIPAVSLVHGGYSPWLSFRGLVGDAARVLVWGSNDVRTYTEMRVAPERLHVVGSVRFDEQMSRRATASAAAAAPEASEGHSARRTACRALGLREESPVVLLLTASINAGFAQPVADPIRHRRCWAQLVELARARPDLTFAIKPHPSYDHFDYYHALVAIGPPNLLLLEHATLSAALRAATLAVLVNYCTSAALETMMARVPLAYIRDAVYDAPEWHDPLMYSGALKVTCVDALPALVERLSADHAFRAAALADAEVALAEAIDAGAVPALERIVGACAEAASRGAPLRTPAHALLRELASAVASAVDDGAVGSAALRTAWTRLTTAAATAERATRGAGEPIRRGAAYVIGTSVAGDAALARVLAWATAEDGDVAARAELLALDRFVAYGRWRAARRRALRLFAASPRRALASAPLRRLLAKSFVGESRAALATVDGVVRAAARVSALARRVRGPAAR